MMEFDVSKPWVILIPATIPAARKGGEELSRIIRTLRLRAGLSLPPPSIIDDSQPAPEGPSILLNCSAASPEQPGVPGVVFPQSGGAVRPSAQAPRAGFSKNGFAWRAGPLRVEIYGNSPLGLRKGLYHFLAALGMDWPAPGREEFPHPRPEAPGIYVLGDSQVCRGDEKEGAQRQRVLLAGRNLRRKAGEAVLIRAARCGADSVVFPLGKKRPKALLCLAAQYALDIEAGGRELSSLIPRFLFFVKPGLFRMEGGRRKKQGFFCVTNPETIALIRKNALRRFRKAAGEGISVFHLWPEGPEALFRCTCPSCRAFSPEEQRRIALSVAAGALAEATAELIPGAVLSWYEPNPGESQGGDAMQLGEGGNLSIQPNTFRIPRLPEDGGPQTRT